MALRSINGLVALTYLLALSGNFRAMGLPKASPNVVETVVTSKEYPSSHTPDIKENEPSTSSGTVSDNEMAYDSETGGNRKPAAVQSEADTSDVTERELPRRNDALVETDVTGGGETTVTTEVVSSGKSPGDGEIAGDGEIVTLSEASSENIPTGNIETVGDHELSETGKSDGDSEITNEEQGGSSENVTDGVETEADSEGDTSTEDSDDDDEEYLNTTETYDYQEYEDDANEYDELYDLQGKFNHSEYEYDSEYIEDYHDHDAEEYHQDYDYDDYYDENDYDDDDEDDYDDDEDDDDYDYDDDDDDDDYDDDDDDDYDDDDDDDDKTTMPETPKHKHHLITGHKNARIELGEDGKVYMVLKVNETFDPNAYYLDVDNDTKLLLDVEEMNQNYNLLTNHSTENEMANMYLQDQLLEEGDMQQEIFLLLNTTDEDNEEDNASKSSDARLIENVPSDEEKEHERQVFDRAQELDEQQMTINPMIPNDSQVSIGWASVTISPEEMVTLQQNFTYESEDDDEEDDSAQEYEYGYTSANTTDPSQIESEEGSDENFDDNEEEEEEFTNGEMEEGDSSSDDDDDDEDEDEDPFGVIGMDEEDFKKFMDKYKDEVEVNDDYEATTAEEENHQTMSLHDSSVITVSTPLSAESESSGDAEDFENVTITQETVDKHASDPKSPAEADLRQTYDKLVNSSELSQREKDDLVVLERLRREVDSLGGLTVLQKDIVSHHIVKRQVGATEACGSFSKRRRREIKGRHKRGVSNVGRRLEMGNPGFRQLYNQYKNMCNFIAMVAFEK